MSSDDVLDAVGSDGNDSSAKTKWPPHEVETVARALAHTADGTLDLSHASLNRLPPFLHALLREKDPLQHSLDAWEFIAISDAYLNNPEMISALSQLAALARQMSTAFLQSDDETYGEILHSPEDPAYALQLAGIAILEEFGGLEALGHENGAELGELLQRIIEPNISRTDVLRLQSLLERPPRSITADIAERVNQALFGVTFLDLSHNQITRLPQWITKFTELARVDVSSNRLTDIPVFLFEDVSKRINLNISSNPLEHGDGSVVQLGKSTLNISDTHPSSLVVKSDGGQFIAHTADLESVELIGQYTEVSLQGSSNVSEALAPGLRTDSLSLRSCGLTALPRRLQRVETSILDIGRNNFPTLRLTPSVSSCGDGCS